MNNRLDSEVLKTSEIWALPAHGGVNMRTAPFLAIPFLLFYCSFLFFYGLGERDLTSSHEARAAQNAQVILSDGNWGLPRLYNRHVELQKPPLYYWMVALLGQALGGEVDAWAVRLPAALSALACVLFVFFLGRRCGRPLAGFLAAAVLASCLHFTWLARVGRIDMPMTLMMTVAAGSFFLAIRRADSNRHAWPGYVLGYVAIALGILLKGPIAAALVGVIVASFALVETRLSSCRRGLVMSLLWGVPLVLLIAAPWFVWANLQTDNKIWEVFFCYHNLDRGLGSSEALASYPIWYYLPLLLMNLLPWSVALPLACWYFLRRIGWRGDREALFGALWFLTVVVFLSLMSFKRADYLLPAYPGAAWFLGCVAERFFKSCKRSPRPCIGGEETPQTAVLAAERIEIRSTFGLGLLLACYALGWGVYNTWIVPRQEQGWPHQRLAQDIRRLTQRPVIFFRAESHVLAFHVGRPLDTILEWENLEVWASRKWPVYFVMPPDCARDWPAHLSRGRLEEVFRIGDGKRDHPLVVMRSCPQTH